MFLTIGIWVAIYLLCFLLRKHLDFGIKKGWHLHWIICWSVPALFLLVGVLVGIPPQKIFWWGFIISVLLGIGKECLDYSKTKSFNVPDLLISLSAAFASAFLFVMPILNSLEATPIK